MRIIAALLLALAAPLFAQERKVDPTWLYRNVATLPPHSLDLTTNSCHYTPIFGEGDAQSAVLHSITRFGELTVDPQGSCQSVTYPRTEELYFVLDGSGTLHYAEQSHPLTQNDFTYLPPTVPHTVSNSSSQPLRLVIASVRIPADVSLSHPTTLEVANLSELHEQTVEGHPDSVLYKLLIGPATPPRDRINSTYAVADFFLMDFAPGGTNFPHHHEFAEEIYLVLDGQGQMAAGSGTDGIEGLRPAKSADAYYFRPNCTVGFYNQNTPNAKAYILALRALIPIPKNRD